MGKRSKDRPASLHSDPAGPPPLPLPFLDRLALQFPPATVEEILAGFAAGRPTVFRINTLLTEEGSCLAELRAAGLAPSRAAWPDNCWQLDDSLRRQLTESDAFSRGHIYIQNPSSMLAPIALAPQAGEKVLDLCAAPGSKTIQMAAMMANRGWISAVEPVRDRYHRLAANLRKHGVTIAHLYQRDGSLVHRFVPEGFDRVLVDAPCSSEGQFRTAEPDSYRFWHRKKSREMAAKQKKLLYSGIQCLRPGGLLLYSTCTLAVEENEEVLDVLLGHFGGALETVPLHLPCPTLAPLSEWRKRQFSRQVAHARRIVPGPLAEGFFLCLLRKTASTVNHHPNESGGPHGM
ncbi:MAG: RsmB/NOP family class I SAM-dependent RNA methyltransferase [Thermodesulfobacteriota bacterium]